jgi:Anti-sigma-K factor rskA
VSAPLPAGLEDAVIGAITFEQRRTARRSPLPWWLAAAAALVVVITGIVVVTGAEDEEPDEESGGVTFALAATDLAPGASATALFRATPAGLRIVLDAADLQGAGPEEMYEAWIGNGDIRVSCGTFHLRGGDDPISLWAGTDDQSFDTITVTREPLDGDAASSGQVVLRGHFDMPARG